MKAEMHPLTELARQAVESFVKEGRIIQPQELSPEMKSRAGVFVSLKKNGQLRGCIGTFAPLRPNIAEEIVRNAIQSATGDPRFQPVQVSELAELDYSVDILTPAEPVQSESDLNPRRYGVIVEAGSRRGLLLPDLEGVDTVDMQLNICRQKAGIKPNEPVKLYRFEVRRYR